MLVLLEVLAKFLVSKTEYTISVVFAAFGARKIKGLAPNLLRRSYPDALVLCPPKELRSTPIYDPHPH
jgi:hypothetical protein